MTSRVWGTGPAGHTPITAAALNGIEADLDTALAVPDAALAGRVVAGATKVALDGTYANIAAVPPTNLDGGNATSVYTGTFNFDGGSAS